MSSVKKTKKPKNIIEININSTLFNSYKRGNLDTWFAERTGDPYRQVDQGSPSFFGIETNLLFPCPNDVLRIGAGLGFIFPASHSLWGTQIFYGGRQEIVLSPQILSMNIPCRFRLDKGQKFYTTVTPAMLIGWVTGTYTSTNTSLNFTPSPTFGFGLSGECEYFFNKLLGISFKTGIRILKTNLVFKDSTSATGYSQPLLENGERVKPDLSGFYGIVGLILRIAF